MNLLGIDPSTATKKNPIGWALFLDGRYHSSGEKVIKSDDATARIVAACNWLESLMSQILIRNGPVTHLVVEIPMGDHDNRRTDRELGGIYYFLAWLAAKYGAQFCPVAPHEIMAAGLGKHHIAATRLWVQDATGDMNRQIGKDEADSIAAVITYMASARAWDAFGQQ